MNKYNVRFEELEEQLLRIENSRYKASTIIQEAADFIAQELLDEWRVKARNLLVNACGKESEHYRVFIESEKRGNYETNYGVFLRLKAVFHAAKEDYLGGYLTTVKNLVQAELFSDELEQAKELLDKNYYVAAAVIAGVVLETALRELCKANNIVPGKLNKMNDDLAKNGTYNSLIHKQIGALAAIRNSAAHGKYEEFTIEQVKDMIKEIETLITHNLSI